MPKPANDDTDLHRVFRNDDGIWIERPGRVRSVTLIADAEEADQVEKAWQMYLEDRGYLV